MKLNELKPAPGATHKRKRVGRGPGSGLGKTSGRGQTGRRQGAVDEQSPILKAKEEKDRAQNERDGGRKADKPAPEKKEAADESASEESA